MNTQNQRQNRIRIGLKSKYTFFLDEVYEQIRQNEYVHMRDICIKLKIGRQVQTILKQENIIKSIGINKYIWIGKKPSSKMVDLIIEKSRIYAYNKKNYLSNKSGQTQINFKTQITKPNVKPVEKPVVKILNSTPKVKVEKNKVTVSLFWGMFKYQKD